MKTHPQQLVTLVLTSAFLMAAAALAQTPAPGVVPRMKAIVYHEFGSPGVLRLEEIDKPVPTDNQALVKVRAVSVNPLDWHFIEGRPYIGRMLFGFGMFKPTTPRLGVDYAGTVETVGKNVTQLKIGDEVFGGKTGAFAEYICVLPDRAVALKPANITFEQAASVPIAGITALQALRDNGQLRAGQKVLINGASGGVGTFAVQIAKSFGAEVTGVCSTRNLDLVRSLGADHVVDYTKEDFTRNPQRYDLILDNVGTQPLLGFTRILNPAGIYVMVGGGGPNDGRWVGPLARPVKAMVLSPVIRHKMGMMFAELNKKDLTVLADLMQAGKIKPVIDRTYTLEQMPDAIAYLEEGHARGKVVIKLDAPIAASLSTPRAAPTEATAAGPVLLTSEFFAVILGVTIGPILVALALNRAYQRRHPGKRPYRWGYYFSIMSFIAAAGLPLLLGLGLGTVIVCVVIYAILAWSFAQRHHWAWIALTIMSFNPIAWIINSVYLWKRWSERSVGSATTG